tara:strand:+ start:1358 stop:2119 length:762 start_codon:yes stop_codon:yes gene_type:complete
MSTKHITDVIYEVMNHTFEEKKEVKKACKPTLTLSHGGFVSLVDWMATPLDLKVVNSAKISMGAKATEVGVREERLIRYLAKHEHTTPFRHSYVTFHIRAPIFVLRQWMKHQVGCSWNEISGRYVEFEEEGYWSPAEWRESADSIKQGSGGAVTSKVASVATDTYIEAIQTAFRSYQALLEIGVCREQARACLPMSIFSECYWTASLQAVMHFLRLRLDQHTQKEHRDYASAVKRLVCENLQGSKLMLEVLNG